MHLDVNAGIGCCNLTTATMFFFKIGTVRLRWRGPLLTYPALETAGWSTWIMRLKLMAPLGTCWRKEFLISVSACATQNSLLLWNLNDVIRKTHKNLAYFTGYDVPKECSAHPTALLVQTPILFDEVSGRTTDSLVGKDIYGCKLTENRRWEINWARGGLTTVIAG